MQGRSLSSSVVMAVAAEAAAASGAEAVAVQDRPPRPAAGTVRVLNKTKPITETQSLKCR